MAKKYNAVPDPAAGAAAEAVVPGRRLLDTAAGGGSNAGAEDADAGNLPVAAAAADNEAPQPAELGAPAPVPAAAALPPPEDDLPDIGPDASDYDPDGSISPLPPSSPFGSPATPINAAPSTRPPGLCPPGASCSGSPPSARPAVHAPGATLITVLTAAAVALVLLAVALLLFIRRKRRRAVPPVSDRARWPPVAPPPRPMERVPPSTSVSAASHSTSGAHSQHQPLIRQAGSAAPAEHSRQELAQLQRGGGAAPRSAVATAVERMLDGLIRDRERFISHEARNTTMQALFGAAAIKALSVPPLGDRVHGTSRGHGGSEAGGSRPTLLQRSQPEDEDASLLWVHYQAFSTTEQDPRQNALWMFRDANRLYHQPELLSCIYVGFLFKGSEQEPHRHLGCHGAVLRELNREVRTLVESTGGAQGQVDTLAAMIRIAFTSWVGRELNGCYHMEVAGDLIRRVEDLPPAGEVYEKWVGLSHVYGVPLHRLDAPH